MNRSFRDSRRFAELARLSNLPTCLSNVLVGCALGSVGGPFPWPAVPGLALAIFLLYIMGMVLNDLMDVEIDSRERPGRPLPSGRVTLREARNLVTGCYVGGLGILALFGLPALCAGSTLILAIIAYNLLHKQHAWAALLMGACRGLVYVTVAVSVGGQVAWPLLGGAAMLLAGYVGIVTVVAQRESGEQLGGRRWASPLTAALAPLILVTSPLPIMTSSVLAAVALLIWTLRSVWLSMSVPAYPRRAIMGWLSGICLIDAMFLTLFGTLPAVVLALACFVMTARSHRRISGT